MRLVGYILESCDSGLQTALSFSATGIIPLESTITISQESVAIRDEKADFETYWFPVQ